MVGLVGAHLRVGAQGEVAVRLEEALVGAEEREVLADLQEPLEEQGELRRDSILHHQKNAPVRSNSIYDS